MRRNARRNRCGFEDPHCKRNSQVICSHAQNKEIGRDAPGKLYLLPEQLHLCWLESVGLDTNTVWTEGTYTSHRYSHAIWLGTCSMHHVYLANTGARSYLTIHSKAPLRLHKHRVLFLSLLIGMFLGYAGSCTTWRMRKVKKKICSASLALTILIRFFYSSYPLLFSMI